MICTDVAPNSRISVESERHEVLPAASHHHDRRRRTGAGTLRVLLEIGPPDEAENLPDVVEDLDGGRGIVDRGRSALLAMSTIIRIPPTRGLGRRCARRPRARSHSFEVLRGTVAELAAVAMDQRFTGVHEVANQRWHTETGAMGASPRDETVGSTGLYRAAAAVSHDECWIRASCSIPYSHRMSVRSVRRTVCANVERAARATSAATATGLSLRMLRSKKTMKTSRHSETEKGGQGHTEVRDAVVLDPSEHRERITPGCQRAPRASPSAGGRGTTGA